MRNIITIALAAAFAVQASADSIMTLFAGNNNGSAGGGVYFDVTVSAAAIQITGFDVNSTAPAGTGFGFQAWTHTGTYAGTEANPAAWTMVATGSGVAAGTDQPSAVTLNAPFVLNNGVNALALVLADVGGGNAVTHRYTNGNGSNQNYSNADVALSLGSATNVAFSGTPFSPRVWNGTIYYDVVPEPGTFIAIGIGLAGLALARRRK